MKSFALLLLLTGAVHAADPDFDTYWRDGKAELNAYRLTVSRYGQERQGRAVLIYVTEPFSESKRVKAEKPGTDTFDAFKLNIIRDFQTGLYDYNTMVSVFTRSADFSPVKISFTSAEWCGHVYEELLVHPGTITGNYFSYFEGETTARQLDRPKDGLLEDELLIALRGLRGEFRPRANVPFLPGVYFSRLAHQPPTWTTADITRAGNVFTVKIADGRIGKFTVEEKYPHRILRWELLPDIKAELTGTIRVPYWQLNKNGDEKYLKELGLEPTVKPQ